MEKRKDVIPGFMPVKLTTVSGAFVHEDFIPPFLTYPDVITFGVRTFLRHNIKKPDAAEGEYIEVFRYGLNP